MFLRKPLFLGLLIGFAGVFSFSGNASAQTDNHDRLAESIPVGKVQMIWPRLDGSQRTMVDLLAADFFQNELSAAQRERIFAVDANSYRNASGDERDAMRAERRREWQARSEEVSSDTGTSYDRLSEDQKAPFRRYAIDQLGLSMPVQEPVGAAGRDTV